MFRTTGMRIIVQKSRVALDGNVISNKTVKGQASQYDSSNIPNVKGFSDAVVKVPDTPVGYAGASKNTDYKNPEYYCYHVDSFGDSMVELAKYRLPAPSNKAND
ncbi:PREDICTED: uncharacterized protein LOC105361231 [Ceratosolen solmsi marchali]|uniref:Uncharacterized protein LOC105361231 n=1 Tax=Ceratosolen solmsi marchali TaxID=326594 RepID=A0AAJ6YEL9_9HYME|nr:PREDICTED: uncharacterized protein LOC105361231 [Ceratosolen solmsi marchali]